MLEGQNPTKSRLAPWIVLVVTGHWFLSIQQVLLLPYLLLRIAIQLEGSCFIYCNNYLWSSAHVSQSVWWNCWSPCWCKWFCWFHSPPTCLNVCGAPVAMLSAIAVKATNVWRKNFLKQKGVLPDSLKWLMLSTNSPHFFMTQFDFVAHNGISWYFSDWSTCRACG